MNRSKSWYTNATATGKSWLIVSQLLMAASIEKRARPVNPWLQLVRVFGLFLGGGVTGLILTWWAAPDSGGAAAISVMLLPTAFAAGLLTWSGLDFLFALVNLLRGRAQVSSPELASKTRKWFVPLSRLR